MYECTDTLPHLIYKDTSGVLMFPKQKSKCDRIFTLYGYIY